MINIKFENTQVFNFEGALRGMRNPMSSWNKSDSFTARICSDCGGLKEGCGGCSRTGVEDVRVYIGKNDMKLAQQLIRAGSEHRTFMRQIIVSVDITAPLYWWKEFDTYKVGTVANSTSTMHKLASQPISIDCFEIDDLTSDIRFDGYHDDCTYSIGETYIPEVISFLESLRKRYLETNDKRYWKELIRWLPESWLQTRTVTMSYENLLAMCGKGQRRFHKLNEWSGADRPELVNFISWARTLPYAQELIFIDEVDAE